MTFRLCPSCAHANPVHASFCNGCGEALAIRCPQCSARNDLASAHCCECGAAIAADASGMVRLPLASADKPRDQGGAPPDDLVPRLSLLDAVWIDPPTLPQPLDPAGADKGLTLKLLNLDVPDGLPDGKSDAPTCISTHDEFILSDPVSMTPASGELEPPVAQPSAAAVFVDAGHAPDPVPPAATSKAKRRAAVRRARLAAQASAATVPAAPPDVLVLDEDDKLRANLCAVLDGFGFLPHPVRTHQEARAALSERVFVASFLHIALDGTDRDAAADLCMRARQALAQGSVRAAALIIVGSGERPVERVRASMAGADQFLVNPASRGDVARALDACGVDLPSDPRRG